MKFEDEVGEDQSDTLFESGWYTPAGYSHPSSKTSPISLNFYDGYEESEFIEGSDPMAECDYNEISDVTQGAHITYDDTYYYVKNVQLDGTKRAFLYLRKVV